MKIRSRLKFDEVRRFIFVQFFGLGIKSRRVLCKWSENVQRFDIAFSSLKKFVNFYELDAINVSYN